MLKRLTAPLLVLTLAGAANGAEPSDGDLDARFKNVVQPFLATYCLGCHSGERAAAHLDLSRYTTPASVADDYGRWSLLLDKLTAAQMPPPAAPRQPEAEARRQVAEWVRALLDAEARRHAGDPGPVLARRLSNAEYDNTIRDLTGVDIRPAREFPVDPTNMAGFDNSGESLSMSPAMVNKYLQAARTVANHLVLKPAGIAFAPHLVLVETDRDKYCINQIIEFYRRQNTNYADYFRAVWRYAHRARLGMGRASIADVAAEAKVSPKYLQTVWKALVTREDIGPLARLQAMWRELPSPDRDGKATGEVERMRDFRVEAMSSFVSSVRRKIATRVPMIEDAGIRGGVEIGEPFLMWRNRQYASHRRSFDRTALQVDGEPPVEDAPQIMKPIAARDAPTMLPRYTIRDADLHVPVGARARYEAAFEKFASVFPDAFYVPERGRYFPYTERDSDKGRYLSAGFHNIMGYFRDDQALYELVLDEAQQRELDGYWRDLDFVAGGLPRTYTQFYLSESGAARQDAQTGGVSSVDVENIFTPERVREVREFYLARVRPSNNALALEAVEQHFDWVDETLRWLDRARVESEPLHLAEVLKFAGRAYRRPLTQAEADGLRRFYQSLREEDGLPHEEAMRDTIVRILMSPNFIYRMDGTN